ncbi:facilitated trehalose transporter Tret1-2 homolog isoform X4 [Microplitis mediator]|uniref:facilitated trehalose transporter Tret1-2 homolog isoform X4 n=1 Tax=Microplitis mediator TaxID=375433 RepID=UPI00255509BC|nr:facilitated trehalose transporter Tret1-2 homolog isoform X4 [Microplitis mediator]
MCMLRLIVIKTSSVRSAIYQTELILITNVSDVSIGLFFTWNICIMAGGAAMAWSNPILLMLGEDPVNEENPLGRPISEEEAAWIGSLAAVGTLIICLFPGYLAEKWGRRATLLSSVVPYLLGWIILATGKSIEALYVARFVSGLGIAVAFAILPMYCGEIAETSIRGILAFFVLFLPMPESPHYLAAKGRTEEVIKVLARLRGKSEDAVRYEANEIEAAVRENLNRKATIMDLFKVKANLKALFITCALVTFQQMSGIVVVLLYSELIFASAGNVGISSSLETIIVGLVQLFGSCVNPLVVDRLGRRILLIISGTGSALSLGAIGLFFYLKDAAKSDVSGIGWLPLTSMIIYMSTYSVGLGPLPWTIMGEMFSPEIKTKASGITVFICCFLAFVVSKYFISVAVSFGQFTAFWFFGVFCILSVLFTVFILPETKGKSLQEIQNELAGKASK